MVDKTEALNKVIEQVNYVKEVAADYTIECDSITMMRALIDEGYKAYLKYPVTDWETFSNLVQLGASDIYIDGPLGFQCDNLKKGKGETKVRVSPTISPNASLGTSSNVNTFFIRPEDLHLYDEAIDIIDFHEPNQEKEDTLYTIYNRGSFNFDLKELIQALNMTVPNLFIRPEFAAARLNCAQKCKQPGRLCHLCDVEFSLTNKVISYFNKSD